jgi:tight adherence protein C
MLILFGIMIGVAVLSLWWGVTAKPPAARANLFAGLVVEQPAKPKMPVLHSVGQALRRLLPTSYLQGLDKSLVQAAHPWGLDMSRLLGAKAAASVVTLLVGIAIGYPLFGMLAALLMFFLPDYLVLAERDKRTAEIQAAAADTIDQLTIVVEAGLGFDAALRRVAMSGEGPLAVELQRTVEDIRAGIPRDQALRSFADRTRLPEIQQLVTALIQAQRYGVTISETLRIQSAELRDRRAQAVEEKAAKLATKILFPVVFCFLPVFMIVLVAPSAIEIIGKF